MPGYRPAAALLTLCLLLAGCQGSGGARPTPSIHVQGSGVKCEGDDHGFEDAQLGWSFCYPATWRFLERVQRSDSPPGTDVALNITDVSTGPDSGKFAFLIIGTYDRGSSSTLKDWLAVNLRIQPQLEPIAWGNAQEAVRISGQSKRFALTQHHVVELDPRSGAGNLDLEAALAPRLRTWKFIY